VAKRKKPQPPKYAPAAPPPRKSSLPAYALIVAATLIVYASVASHPFITLDDPDYVVRNDMVRKGLTGEGIGWAFTTYQASNWHPLTWISHMIDVSLFDARPGAHLLMNALLHALAAAALFAALHALTGQRGRSLAVALLFALHPLAIESAAWISERKNVLCALFWFLALWKYAHHARSRRTRDYVLVAFFFALSLLAKPMAVTFPAVLLLIDYWPLGRIRLAEKIPLFALSAIDSALTIRAQQNAIETLHALPFAVRVENAFVSYVRYLGKTFWPRDLAVFYPYHDPSAAFALLAAALLIAITAAVFVLRKRRPFLLTGWLWFLGTLVPMIGIVQVGEQSIANRYMYVAIVGLALALVWLVAELTQRLPQRRVVQPAIAGVLCAILAIRTFVELRYWRSSKELFSHAIAVAGPSELSHNNLGMAYLEEGDVARGEAEFRESVAINPDGLDARVNLANALARQDRGEETIAAYQAVLAIDPSLPDIHNNLGVALARQGRMSEAMPHFYEALRIDPHFMPARQVLEQLARQGVDVRRDR